MANNQTPVIRVCPDYSETLGDVAVEMMSEYGLTLDEWQANIQKDWLSFGEDGKFSASMCGLSLPRQNGKTANVKGRCIVGVTVLNETILYTAHEVKTARKTFDEMASMFDENGAFPDLAGQVDYIRRANGQEEIKLVDWQDEDGNWNTGGRIIFSARSRGASRGFTADVLICDEAQELTTEQMSALLPVISSGRNQNPQTILIGTPPAPGCQADVFIATRKQALSDEPGKVCWHEWSVDEIGDVTDWERVERANPALDKRLMRSAVEAEMSALSPDYFARERLGWWSKQSVNAVIRMDKWRECSTSNPPVDGAVSYAVKFSSDGSHGVIAVCLKAEKPHVEVVEVRSMSNGLSWFADWLEFRSEQATAICIDGMSNAQPLIDELLSRGVSKKKLVKPKAVDITTACSSFLNLINEHNLTHFDQHELNQAVKTTTKRNIGSSGGFGFAGDGSELIEASALAIWCAKDKKTNPNKKMRVSF